MGANYDLDVELKIKPTVAPAEAWQFVSHLLSTFETALGFLGSECVFKEENDRKLCIFLKWGLEVDSSLLERSRDTMSTLQELGEVSQHTHLTEAFSL